MGKSQFWRGMLVQGHWCSFNILSGIGLLLIIIDIKQTFPTVFMVAVLLAPEQQQEQLHENLLLILVLSLIWVIERAKKFQLKAGKLWKCPPPYL
jgi:hypothetical protein